MNEEFLHYVWQYKLYLPDLHTTNGEEIEVIHPGTPNTDGGPDFFNAKIKIDDTLWAGNVEIHQNEKEWYQHQHHQDATYNNVILHIVLYANNTTINANNRLVPVCQIQIPDSLSDKYQSLQTNKLWIPCANSISKVKPFHLDQWLNRLLVEKLEKKSDLINTLLETSNNNWDQVFFVLLARSFGFSINGLPFELVARQTPLNILLKHSNNLFQLEAILFGQSGLLNSNSSDSHLIALRKEYKFLKAKYQLIPIEQHLWQFLRLRPSNFPTIRIAQLASILHQTKGIFDRLQSFNHLNSLTQELNAQPSDYWNTHYTFKNISKYKVKKLGQSSQLRIIYNTIIPYLFIFATKHNNEERKEKIVDFLYQQKPEQNNLLNNWKALGVKSNNEGRAQALIFLKNSYCNHKKCLNCRIGHEVLCKT